jgi:hypothetical protein
MFFYIFLNFNILIYILFILYEANNFQIIFKLYLNHKFLILPNIFRIIHYYYGYKIQNTDIVTQTMLEPIKRNSFGLQTITPSPA